jgi:hypothetical protein
MTRMRTRGPRRLLSALAGGAALAAAGCQELTLTNPNNPDRGRTLRQPASVEALASSSFRAWWPNAHDEAPVWALSTMADEFTAAFFDFGILTASSEPRVAYDNSPTYADRFVNQDPWYSLYATLAQTNDVLVATDSGLKIMNGTQDDTPRARAVAKFVQGLSHGYLALYFDRAWIINERVLPDTLVVPGTTRLKGEASPYRAVMDTALSELAEAARIAQAGSFTLPEGGWVFQSMNAQEFARLARSYSARLRAQVARSREERQAVNWTQVIADVDAGMTRDFAPVAVPGVFFNDFTRVAARTRVATQPGDFARVDYWTLGPADSTNRFLGWLSTPVSSRTRFQMVTKDRRIQPAGQPAQDGKYFGYTTSQRFQDARGTYHQSNYWYKRSGTGNLWENGPQLALSVDEMQLLKAEGLIRLNRAAEAVPLVNRTRVRNGELPPVTLEGPPTGAGCVPRKLDGQCGSLWDALRYEKRLELIGVHPAGAFLDARGWHMLLQGTPIHLPVPGRELETMQLPNYTFGGGGAGSAPAAEPERCPVALPRCPQ